MTAKEALIEAVEGFSEEQAARLLPLANQSLLDWLEATSLSTSTEELLRLPAELRELILKYERRYYNAEDAAADLAEWEDWQAGTGSDIDLTNE